ncbi:MAG TPA: DMT family transporter [Gemmatimonadales bacterium]
MLFSAMPDSHRRAALALLLAAFLFSTGGAAIKWAHFGGWQIASLRAGIAAATLLLLIPSARRGWGWRPALVGTAYAATCICFVLANRLTTSAHAIFIQSASPLFVLLLGPLLLRERVTRRDALFMLPIGLGLALFFAGRPAPSATAPDPLAGNLIAALSAVTFAFAVIGFRWLGRSGGIGGATPLTAAAMGNLIAFGAALPMALPLGGHTARDWAVIVYLGVFQIGLAYVLVAGALVRIGALEASLVLLLEPALNPFWSWLVHGEVPGPPALAGAALILGATVVRASLSEPRKGLTETRSAR